MRGNIGVGRRRIFFEVQKCLKAGEPAQAPAAPESCYAGTKGGFPINIP